MNGPDGKYAWTVKIGERGQFVIPKEARDLFGIEPGSTMLLLGDAERGLALVAPGDFMHVVRELHDSIRGKDTDQ